MKEITTTAIIGMGALGMLYGDLIMEHLGTESVCFVADPDRVGRYRGMEFTVNGKHREFPIADSREAVAVDLVIVAVKYNALQSALDTMKNCVGPDTTIISVMNGITSEEIIGERFGAKKLVHTIAQGMDAVKFGGALNYTKPGELRIGIRQENTENRLRLEALARFLTHAGIAYTVEPDILYRLWGKFMLNIGINQTCMALETDYGGALEPGKPFDTLVGAMEEAMAVAHAEGIPLRKEDLTSYIDLIRTLSPAGMPSMRQDAIARRPSEVEMFSGALRKMAAKHGIPVPVNDWLYGRIREMEAGYKA